MNAVTDSTPDAPPATGAGPATSCATAGTARATSDHGGFRLVSHFQPIFSLTHHRVVGHEALLRATALTSGAATPPMALFASPWTAPPCCSTWPPTRAATPTSGCS
jgi:hypothetical protein